MQKNFQLFQKKIKISFKNLKLLAKALTHKSYDPIDNNEKIEFLGDRVLGLVIAKKLKKMDIEKYILTLSSTKSRVKIEDKVLSDSCEAVIGAIYLDKGFNIAEKFILDHWKDHIDKSVITQVDAKTKLQEYSLKRYKKLPIYQLISNTGPRHQPTFKVSVKIFNGKSYHGEGKSKKDAEQHAAKLCLGSLK